LKYISKICDAIEPLVPVTVFAKDAHFALADMAKLNCNTIGLDWTINPQDARIIIGHEKHYKVMLTLACYMVMKNN